MNVGDIIFVRGHNTIGKLISLFDGKFTHCAVVILEDGHVIESQGFVGTRIVPFYFDNYEVISVNLTDEEKDKLIHIAVKLTGTKYDYLQILGELIESVFRFREKKFLNSPDKFICSELVDIILFALGKIPDDEYLADKTPNELYQYLMTLSSTLTDVK